MDCSDSIGIVVLRQPEEFLHACSGQCQPSLVGLAIEGRAANCTIVPAKVSAA